MRKYAILDENIVVEVLDLDEDSYRKKSSYHQLIVDIEDLFIQPQVGWFLSENKLIPPVNQAIGLGDLIKAKIKSFQDQAPGLLRDMYVQNTLLGITTAQSDAMFSDYQDVLIRIREGAWSTALYRLSQKAPNGFVTQEMIDSWKALLISRMS